MLICCLTCSVASAITVHIGAVYLSTSIVNGTGLEEARRLESGCRATQ